MDLSPRASTAPSARVPNARVPAPHPTVPTPSQSEVADVSSAAPHPHTGSNARSPCAIFLSFSGRPIGTSGRPSSTPRFRVAPSSAPLGALWMPVSSESHTDSNPPHTALRPFGCIAPRAAQPYHGRALRALPLTPQLRCKRTSPTRSTPLRFERWLGRCRERGTGSLIYFH